MRACIGRSRFSDECRQRIVGSEINAKIHRSSNPIGRIVGRPRADRGAATTELCARDLAEDGWDARESGDEGDPPAGAACGVLIER